MAYAIGLSSGEEVPDNVALFLAEWVVVALDRASSDRAILYDMLMRCESPLEQLLLIALCQEFEPRVRHSDRLFANLLAEGLERYIVEIRQQVPISTQENNYRADFLITVSSGTPDSRDYDDLIKLVVEIDGHDYHERTKQQARHDKKRDRAMTTESYVVMRFTGSEVYESPETVAHEIHEFLIKRAQLAWKPKEEP